MAKVPTNQDKSQTIKIAKVSNNNITVGSQVIATSTGYQGAALVTVFPGGLSAIIPAPNIIIETNDENE